MLRITDAQKNWLCNRFELDMGIISDAIDLMDEIHIEDPIAAIGAILARGQEAPVHGDPTEWRRRRGEEWARNVRAADPDLEKAFKSTQDEAREAQLSGEFIYVVEVRVRPDDGERWEEVMFVASSNRKAIEYIETTSKKGNVHAGDGVWAWALQSIKIDDEKSPSHNLRFFDMHGTPHDDPTDAFEVSRKAAPSP